MFTAAIAEKQKDRSRIKLEPSTTHHSITQNDGYYYLFNRWYYDLNSCTSWFTTAISKQRSTVHDAVRLAYLLWCWLGTYTVLRPSHFLTWIPGTISTSFVSPFFTRHLLLVHSRAASRPQPLKTVLAENGPTLSAQSPPYCVQVHFRLVRIRSFGRDYPLVVIYYHRYPQYPPPPPPPRPPPPPQSATLGTQWQPLSGHQLKAKTA